MALGVLAFPLILVFIALVVAVAIAYFRPKESRVGCLLVSGGLLFVCALTVVMLFISWNTH